MFPLGFPEVDGPATVGSPPAAKSTPEGPGSASGFDEAAAASSSIELISNLGFFRWAFGPNVSWKGSVSTMCGRY